MFLPDEDRSTYEEGIRRGHALLSVDVDESRADEVVQLLEKNTEALDVEAKSEEWRQSGWTGPQSSSQSLAYDTPAESGTATTPSYQTSGLNASQTSYEQGGETGSARFVSDTDQQVDFRPDANLGGPERATGSDAFAGARETLETGREEHVPIIEERLAVGKREIERGGARVRSYVVERPVHEQVSLREEHVSIERRPLDRPLSDADDAFRDREIEVRETAEEAVVAKEARVTEELVIRKDQEQRIETIDDTVRHTEVDVDDGIGLREERSFQGGGDAERFADEERRTQGPSSDPNLTNRP